MTEKLYQVTTVVKEYHGCKDVTFTWFYADERSAPRPYAELIADYDPHNPGAPFCEAHIHELFSEDEARQLIAYLEREHHEAGTTSISEAELPSANNVMGFSATPVGGGTDFHMLHKAPQYSLPFKVEGYFDLRQHWSDNDQVHRNA